LLKIGIVGAGVLGISLAYWLSNLTDHEVYLIEKEKTPAYHSTARNTGVIHTPFFIPPEAKEVTQSWINSYEAWVETASIFHQPAKVNGQLEVAMNEDDIKTLELHKKWAKDNGLNEDEILLLDKNELKRFSEELSSTFGLFSKKEINVNFKNLVKSIYENFLKNNVKSIFNFQLKSLYEKSGLIYLQGWSENHEIEINLDFLINATGNNSLNIYKMLGHNIEYSEIRVKATYYRISDDCPSINTNVFTVPKYPKFPFLDPHYILRPDNTKDIGPTISIVYKPFGYDEKFMVSLFNILLNSDFKDIKNYNTLFIKEGLIKILIKDGFRIYFKNSMKKFFSKVFPPLLKCDIFPKDPGIMHYLLNDKGIMQKTVIKETENTLHILNYDAPGATGAPYYSFTVVKDLINKGILKRINNTEIKMWKSIVDKFYF